MPIPLPNLDDRTFADLVEEMRALIPRYAPDWTDHNVSDPGIMLIELFAWLAEALIYRLNRIPEGSEMRFLELLGATSTDLDEARQEAIGALKTRWRAITAGDFEALVLGKADFHLARVQCLPELDLTAPDPYATHPGHVTIIIVPHSTEDKPSPSAQLRQQVWDFLNDRRLITCRHHVLPPTYTTVRVQTEVVGRAQLKETTLKDRIKDGLRAFFDPLEGGPDKKGWPFGRSVYASEVYQVIENTEDVDHVESLRLEWWLESSTWQDAGDQVVIPPHSLVHFDIQSSSIIIVGAGR